ncbi:hypothetical protein [Campylobacter sp. US33a]|uniref:hypothetical protein n=1 Tax=Campylobacter sp. US33a TaxID=2498120 RepID=UPI001068935C|nr:hypothetical protein [Campylobacter sp. US33a]TEY02019.1 hypothetical protein ELQ16_06605 [Campylobacter sp. US33a]
MRNFTFIASSLILAQSLYSQSEIEIERKFLDQNTSQNLNTKNKQSLNENTKNPFIKKHRKKFKRSNIYK